MKGTVGVSPGAKFPRITRELREQIRKLAPGSPVPSEAALCAKYDNVSRTTLRRALARLEEEGLIMTAPGVGRVVRDPDADHEEGERDALLQYRRIAADLRGQIQRGELKPGDPLPSEAEIVRRYGVSRNTAVRAFAHLKEAGLITSVHGKGRFVRGRRGT